MFKNESRILEDWIKHYLSEGVSHFFLIDNGSTDNYTPITRKYARYITLFVDPSRPHPNPQDQLLNRHVLSRCKDYDWVIVCDTDEYIYARANRTKIPDILKALPRHVNSVWLPWKRFGSNGHRDQPVRIIPSFRRRESYAVHMQVGVALSSIPHPAFGKTITRTKSLSRLGTHTSAIGGSRDTNVYDSRGARYHGPWDYTKHTLHLNHYELMSQEYYEKVKCVRGGGQSQHQTSKYTMGHFFQADQKYNRVTDTELSNKRY
jgi:hypothetical protein